MMIAGLAIGLLLAVGEQDVVTTARDLYASAAYEDALALLNRVPETSRPPDEARAVSQYRVFCLLALGRTSEAERAMETMIMRDPTYQPPAGDVSRRVQRRPPPRPAGDHSGEIRCRQIGIRSEGVGRRRNGVRPRARRDERSGS